MWGSMGSKKTVCIRCRGSHARGGCGKVLTRPQAVVGLIEAAALDPIEEALSNRELTGKEAVRAFRRAWESVYGPQKWKVAL